MKINNSHPDADIQKVYKEFSVQIKNAIDAAEPGADFKDIRQAVVSLGLVDSGGNALTAERLTDGIIHQICIDNGIEVMPG